MFFEECKSFSRKQMSEYITHAIDISFDEESSDYSDEENSNEENSNEESKFE